MRPLTLLRAAAWIAVVLTGWSLNIRWGSDAAVGNGPPGQWERQVVGAVLLTGVSALFLFFVRPRGRSFSRPAAVSVAASAGALALAVYLRIDASSSGFPDLARGPGWLWMSGGCGLALGCAIAALATSMKPPSGPRPARSSIKKKGKRK